MLIMQGILVFNFVNWTEPEYNGPFPTWARTLGWMMMISSILVIPLDWVYFIWTTPGAYWKVCMNKWVKTG